MTREQVEYAVADLVKLGRLAAKDGSPAGHWQFGPVETYVIVGEMVRRGVKWNRRRDVKEGVEAWIEGDALGRRIMLVPWERVWSKEKRAEVLSVPAVVDCVEYPTGRVTGRLVCGGAEDGRPVYRWEGVGGEGGGNAPVAGEDKG